MIFLVAVILLRALSAQGASAAPPAGFEALARQAAAARDAQHLDEALGLYRKALKLKPTWEEGWWNAGSIAYDRDRYAECAPAFQRLAALQPGSAPAWTMSGLCEYRLRYYHAALDSLRHAERLGFQEPTELARLGRLHYAYVLTKTGNFEKALTVLTELTRLDRKTPAVSVAAGIAGLRKPWLPSEVPEPDRPKVIAVGDAMSAAMEMDSKEATPKFEAALRDFPQDANLHFRFGAYLMQQTPDRGIEEIRKALELDSSHVPALVGLSAIYLKREEPQTALGYAVKAVALSPADFATHIALGRALLATEDLAPAARELQLATSLAPENADAHYSLASAYSRLGRKEDAAREHREFQRLRKLSDSQPSTIK